MEADLSEVAAFLVNVALLDSSESKSWSSVVADLLPAKTHLDAMFDELAAVPMNRELPTDKVDAFAACLDTNFSVSLLRRGQLAIGNVWHR